MTAKEVKFGDDARKKLANGVKLLIISNESLLIFISSFR